MSLLGERFMERVVTPETQSTDVSKTMNIARQFEGMEAVAQHVEEDDEREGDSE